MPRSSVTRRSSGRSRPGSRVNMSASNRRVPPRCFPLSGWSIWRSLHRCLSTACCCSLCPFARWVSCSLCLGFRLCCRCLLAVRVTPVHLGLRPGFYTWAFGAVMGALVMGVCVSVLRYKDGLVHGWFGGVLTVLHTIRLWLDINYIYSSNPSVNIQKFQDLHDQNITDQTILSTNRYIHLTLHDVTMSFYTMSTPMFNAMSNTMSNKLSDTEADNEGQNSTPLPYGWRLPQASNFSYEHAMDIPPMYRGRATLAPFPDAISALAPTPDYLSTGAPRQVVLWMRCCGCNNLVNPALASENKCPICAHTECDSCGQENVP